MKDELPMSDVLEKNAIRPQDSQNQDSWFRDVNYIVSKVKMTVTLTTRINSLSHDNLDTYDKWWIRVHWYHP